MIKHFEENINGKDFIVGDIHGCFSLLAKKLKEVNFDKTKDRLFSVGDLVDRGNESEECYKWLNKPWFHAVRGNHEQMVIDVKYGLWPEHNLYINGGAWFFGLTHEEQMCYVDLFDSLPYVITVDTKFGKVGIIHADCPVSDWNLLDLDDRHAKEMCLWGRIRITYQDYIPIENIWRVFHGHTITEERVQYGNVHFIDTGAVFSGEFTLIELISD